jgi:hypothetical protein
MNNTAIEWQTTMERFQNASTGRDLRKKLIECIKMCHMSHAENVLKQNIYYADIIEWPGGGVLPPGWILDPNLDIYVKIPESQTEEQTEVENG